ncbi:MULTISPECIES: hypothetical protein [unclassified Anaerobiospirillum]|uniref:hypothetical protein n=1 Tax=unclassified Anaerobiospirillum TaxID=2647410 RepID=UPI001FF4046D|nr:MULTISPECIES: hypothetical protein [unclassified Anaerobiospirillum]MCK0535162.1 hypothetical protein [Anaerobiospirillum sp. NML120511]MCK0539404.1 hypothetical protein [Anaerobiospirillum sp. NML02-A-032]
MAGRDGAAMTEENVAPERAWGLQRRQQGRAAAGSGNSVKVELELELELDSG